MKIYEAIDLLSLENYILHMNERYDCIYPQYEASRKIMF